MANHTHVSYFILSGYFNLSQLRYLIFTCVALFYTIIVGANVVLIVVISQSRTLHEPMCAFLCSLFLNEIYGSTALFPLLLLHILRDVHTVPYSLCFLQIFCLYSYATVEFFILAVMAYDRYQAICFPMQYHLQLNNRNVLLLVAVSWSGAFVINIVPITLITPLKLCSNIIPKVYCDNYLIVKMACSSTRVNNIYGLFATALAVFSPIAFILFTYVHILRVCFSASPQTKQKALSTCVPHCISLVNFTFGVCFEVLQSRFDMSSVPPVIRVLLSLYWLSCPPLLSPLIYGLNVSKIRTSCRNLFGKVNMKVALLLCLNKQ